VYLYRRTGKNAGLAEEMGMEQVMRVFGDTKRNTSIADYVWLPLRFEAPSEAYLSGRVLIDWLDEWRIEDCESEG